MELTCNTQLQPSEAVELLGSGQWHLVSGRSKWRAGLAEADMRLITAAHLVNDNEIEVEVQPGPGQEIGPLATGPIELILHPGNRTHEIKIWGDRPTESSRQFNIRQLVVMMSFQKITDSDVP